KVDHETSQHQSTVESTSQRWSRSVEISGTRRCAFELLVVQRLHARMPLERKSGVAEIRNALRALETRRLAVARALLQQCRSVRPNRLHHSVAFKCDCRSCAGPFIDGEDARDFREAFAATLHAAKIRSLVCDKRETKWCVARQSDFVGRHVCTISRAEHRNRGGESARSAWIRSSTSERSEMLR